MRDGRNLLKQCSNQMDVLFEVKLCSSYSKFLPGHSPPLFPASPRRSLFLFLSLSLMSVLTTKLTDFMMGVVVQWLQSDCPGFDSRSLQAVSTLIWIKVYAKYPTFK